MLYLNQRKLGHVEYLHNVDGGGAPKERRNVGTSGCGLCSACMIVEHLTNSMLSIEDCVALSYQSGANKAIGTRLKLLGPAVAERFGLEYKETNDCEEVLVHLQNGGEAIACVGGDREGYKGIFSRGSHYIVLVSYDGTDICVLDPATEEGRYDVEGSEGKLNLDHLPFIYCSPDVIAEETKNVSMAYYLFKRKK